MSSKPQVSEDYARHTGSAENYNPGGYLYAAQLSSGGKKAETGAPGIDVKEVVAPYVPAKDIVFGIGPLFLALGNGYRLAGGQLFINPDSTVDSNAAQKAFEKTKYLIDYGQSGSDEMEVNLPFSERYRLRQELLNNEVPEAALTPEGAPIKRAEANDTSERNDDMNGRDSTITGDKESTEEQEASAARSPSEVGTRKSLEQVQLQARAKIVDSYRSATAKKVLDDMGKRAGQIRQDNFGEAVAQRLSKLRKEVGSLSREEQDFFSNLLQQDFYVTHATRVKPENKKGDLVLYSHRQLTQNNIGFNPGTTSLDIAEYGNDNYVFFGLETGAVPKKTWSTFGQKFYRAKYDHPVFTHSALMLVDPILSTAQNPARVKGLSGEGVSAVLGKTHSYPASISQGRAESLTTLGYKLIAAARGLSEQDRALVLSARTDEEVNNVINGIFRPQVLVPKMVGLKKEDFTIHQSK